MTPTSQRTISSSPNNTNKSIRSNNTVSKSPEPLRTVTGTVTRPRPAHSLVNKSKMNTNIKTQIPTIIQPTSTTPRVSDLDALMAEKQNKPKTPSPTATVEVKTTFVSPAPVVNNIRRSLFSPDSVKVVRPVRSQELKIFSCHLTTDKTPPIDEISSASNIDETLSTITPPSISEEIKNDNQTPDKHDDSSSNTSAVLRDLSEDSLNSLNEHYHIRQLLKSSKLNLFFFFLSLIKKNTFFRCFYNRN